MPLMAGCRSARPDGHRPRPLSRESASAAGGSPRLASPPASRASGSKRSALRSELAGTNEALAVDPEQMQFPPGRRPQCQPEPPGAEAGPHAPAPRQHQRAAESCLGWVRSRLHRKHRPQWRLHKWCPTAPGMLPFAPSSLLLPRSLCMPLGLGCATCLISLSP